MSPSDLPPAAMSGAPGDAPRRRSPRMRTLVVALVVATLVPFIVWVSAGALREQGRIADRAKAQAEEWAVHGAARLGDGAEKLDAVLLAAPVAVADYSGGGPVADARLRTLHAHATAPVGSLALLSPDGRMVASSQFTPEARAGLSFADRAYFRAALAAPGLVVSEPLKSRLDGTEVLVLARAARTGGDRIVGVVALSTPLDQIAERVGAYALPADAAIAVVDAAGNVLARGGTLDPSGDGCGPPGGGRPGAQDGDRIRAEAIVPGLGWRVCVSRSRAAALAPARAALRADLAASAIYLAIALAFAGGISRSLLRGVGGLRAGAMRIAGGELARRVPERGPAELAALAREFNVMAGELERQREALLEAEARWQFALEGSRTGVWDWHAPSGRLFQSRRAWQLLGLEEASARIDAGAWVERIHPDDLPRARAMLRTVLREAGAAAQVDYRARHADGTWRWLEVRGMAVERDAGGRAVRVIGTSTDVTERKLAERRLERLTRAHAALSSINEAVLHVATPEELYRRFCDIAVGVSDLRLATVRLLDPERGVLALAARSGPHAADLDDVPIPADPDDPGARRPIIVAFREVRVVVANDLAASAADTAWGVAARAAGLLATASSPIRRGGRVVGTLSLVAGERDYFDDDLADLVARMSESLSAALDAFDREAERRRALDELRRSEERFRHLTALSSDWFWEQDDQYRFTFMSGQLLEKTGIDIDTHHGRTRWDVPALNLTDEDWTRHRAALARREPFRDFEIRRPDQNGRVHWVAVSGDPLFDCAGRFVGYRGIGRDITERKLAALEIERLAAERQALADRLQLHLERMPIGCIVSDADGRMTYANRAAGRIVGAAPAELVGKGLVEYFADEGLRSLIPDRRDRSAAISVLGVVTVALRRADGEQRLCELHPTMLRAESEFDGLLTMLVDVTEREHAAAALRESEARYRSLVDVSPDGLVVVRDGRVDYANEAMARIARAGAPETIVGRPFTELFAGPDREGVEELLERLAQEGGPAERSDTQIAALDGRMVDVDIRAASYRWNDAVCTQLTVRDNSLRKAIQRRVLEINAELERRVQARTAELQAANRELEAFSYSVAHDLRAPLRAIDGFARILAEELGDALTGSQRRSLDRVHANISSMAELIDDLLDFARIGRHALECGDVDAGEMCRGVCDELKQVYPAAEVRIGALPVVRADPMLLRQVFANLVGNALKFSARAAQPLVEVGYRLGNGEHLFFVRDNGAGFSMDYAHKLFGMFQRLHGPREFAGTGVGLAIVQRALQRHGGRAWGEGEPGHGATFYFALPA